MNLSNIVQIYVNLLIIQYNNKPKARQMIELIVSTIYGQGQFLADSIYALILEALSYETAIGEQLTRIGKEEGLSRYNNGTYINDDDFRILLAFRIISNNTDLTEYNVDTLLFQFFGADIFFQWNQNMTIFIYANYPNTLIEYAVNQNILPIPTNIGFTVFINTFDILFLDNTNETEDIYPYDNAKNLTFDLVVTT